MILSSGPNLLHEHFPPDDQQSNYYTESTHPRPDRRRDPDRPGARDRRLRDPHRAGPLLKR